MPGAQPLTYDAFISYSHKDIVLAKRIHRQLTKLGKAWWQRRILRVFRDEASLGATPQLWPSIENVLLRSRYLILCTSPDSATSPWVQKEVQHWLADGRVGSLLIAATAGDIAWDDSANDFVWTDTTPLPRCLARAFPAEPKWIDFRACRAGGEDQPADANFLSLVADLSAAIRGVPKEDILSEEITQQRRARYWAYGAAGALATTAVVAVAAGLFAWSEQKTAVRERDAALRSQSRFLANLARGLTDNRHVSSTPVLLGLSGLPDEASGLPRPLIASSELAVTQALQSLQETLVVEHPQEAVRYARFSSDGRRILVAAWSGGPVRLFDATTGRQESELPGDKATYSVAVDPTRPDRFMLAYGSGRAMIWNALSDGKVTILAGHADAVLDASFSSDGKQAVTASSDMTARIWNTETGAELQRLPHGAKVYHAAFSRDGHRVLTVSDETRIWNLQSGQPAVTLAQFNERPSVARFSPDEKYVVAGTEDGALIVWDAVSGEKIAQLAGHTDDISVLAFDAAGRVMVTASHDNTARLWDVPSWSPLHTLEGHDDWINTARFSHDGRRLVTASNDGTARLWDVVSGREISRFDVHGDSVNDADFSPDDNSVVTAASDHTVRVWRTHRPEPGVVMGRHDVAARSASFSPDGRNILSAGGNVAIIRKATDGSEVRRLIGHSKPVNAASFRFDGARIATASDDKTVRLWDAATGRELHALAHAGEAHRVMFSPDGARIVTAGRDRIARVWDAETGELALALPEEGSALTAAGFSPDGKYLATGSENGIVRLWQVAQPLSAPAVLSLEECDDAICGINNIAFSPDTQSLAIATQDGRVTIRDLTLTDVKLEISQRCKSGNVENLECEIFDLAFSPDGKRLLTTYYDDSLRLWDSRTGSLLQTLAGHRAAVNAVSFSPDGKHVVSASSDKTVRTWRVYVDANDLVDEAKQRLPRCLTGQERQEAQLQEVPPPKWCITGAGLEKETAPEKWQPKWPYSSKAWKEWLVAVNSGRAATEPSGR